MLLSPPKSFGARGGCCSAIRSWPPPMPTSLGAAIAVAAPGPSVSTRLTPASHVVRLMHFLLDSVICPRCNPQILARSRTSPGPIVILGGMTAPSAIRLRGVVKRFGEITAVDHLDLDVPEGTCVGLLGPNGAGKSTTMRLLTAQAIADEGELEVLGFRLPQESKQARALCGVVPQLDNLDVTLTVEQNLLVFSHLYRIPRSERKDAIERAIVMAKLVPRRDSRVDKLSGGMRRRLLIARALIHRPRLVLLDEPTVGLDPQVRQELWALIDT